MATFKCIEATPESMRHAQNAFNEIDCMVQDSTQKIDAAVAVIRVLLKEPDSVAMRQNIKALCKIICYHTVDVKNYVNAEAEIWSADYVDQKSDEEDDLIAAAVCTKLAEVSHG